MVESELNYGRSTTKYDCKDEIVERELNSGGSTKKYDCKDEKYKRFYKYSYIAVITVSLGILVGYLGYLMSQEETWKKEGSEAPVKRGSITSALSMLTLGIMNLCMDTFGKIDGMSSAATMSLIVGNLTGYVMDKSLAGNEGWSKGEGDNLTKCFRYGFGSVISMSFVRYALTVLMDMYISFLLIHGMTPMAPDWMQNCQPWESFFPTFVTTIVSLITFYTYTNDSRFRYAIRDSETVLIDSFTMFCFVSVSACMYLNTNVKEGKKIHSPKCKAINVLVAFLIMMFLANAKDEQRDVSEGMAWGGLATFAGIVVSMVCLTFLMFSKDGVKRDLGMFGKIILTVSTILVPALLLMTAEAATGIVAIVAFVVLLAITVMFYIKGETFLERLKTFLERLKTLLERLKTPLTKKRSIE